MPSLREAIEQGIRHQRVGRVREAERIYLRVLQAHPEEPNALHLLGLIARQRGQFQAAAERIRKAVAIRPDSAEFHANLGSVLHGLGLHDEAAASFREALRLKPDFVGARSNLLLLEQARPGVTLAHLAREHAEWSARHATAAKAHWRPWPNDRDPDRPLRLGFVSPDLWQHPVGMLIVRFLETAAGRPEMTTHAYANRIAADAVNARIVAAVDTWRDVRGTSDDALEAMVREDAIDVLFDLAGHTARNRLLLFARRPAPIQATWIGYVGTTGLEAMDYVVADRYHVPADAEVHYRERILRLPDGYVVFDPPAEAPPVGPPPALERGSVTFGCFNNPSKINEPLLGLWARVLAAVAGARLVLGYRGFDEPATARRLAGILERHGVEPNRVEFLGGAPRAELLARYGEIDIALDPSPYSGGLTTCEALWMGVPVVTLPGETFASRHSLSHLTNAGCPETIATDPDAYVEIAAALAGDLERLAALRADLRPRMTRSPICDAVRFTDNMQRVLRTAWRAWCASDRAEVSP